MTLFRTLAVFAAALVVGAVGLSSTGHARVPGSYQQTCRDIRIVNVGSPDAQLIAQCRKRNGKWNKSSIAYKRCRSDIYNDNGKLRCDDRGKPLPRGSWQETCRDADIRGNTLTARCRTRSGDMRKTSINYRQCRSEIYNDDGHLRCKGAGRMPGGSWKETCRDARLDGNKLHAVCQKRDGSWRKTDIKYNKCKNDRVMNDNGHLKCG